MYKTIFVVSMLAALSYIGIDINNCPANVSLERTPREARKSSEITLRGRSARG
jgi:hypothetical protein